MSIKLALVVLLLFSASINTQDDKTRQIDNISKDLYIQKIQMDVQTLLKEKLDFGINWGATTLSKGSISLELLNTKLSGVVKVEDVTPSVILEPSCAAKVSVKITDESPFLSFTLSSPSKYTAADAKITEGTTTLKILLSNININRKLVDSEKSLDFYYEANPNKYSVSDLKFDPVIIDPDVAIDLAKDFETKVKNTLTNIFNDGIIFLNNKANVRSIELDTDRRPDNQSRAMRLKTLKRSDCTKDFITTESRVEVADKTDSKEELTYVFNTDLSNHQNIFSISAIEDILKSKVLNDVFTFKVNKNNAADFVGLGFTVRDLGQVFPYLPSNLDRNADYELTCTVRDASLSFSKVKQGLVSVSQIKCLIHLVNDENAFEEFYATYNLTLKPSTGADKKYQWSFTDSSLYDIIVPSKKPFNSGLFSRLVNNAMSKYVVANPFNLFKLIGDSGTYTYIENKGVIYQENK